MGVYTANGYIYKPSYGETGRTTTDLLDQSYDRIDSAMAGAWVDFYDFGTSTLKEIITAIGSTPTVLAIPTDTIPIEEDTTVPANVYLKVPMGAYLDVADGCTLTISAPIEAGPYQIFSWTGTGAIDLSGCPTAKAYINWWGAQSGKTNDATTAFKKAITGLGGQQTLWFPAGLWRITDTITLTSSSSSPARYSIGGENNLTSIIWIDVGATKDAISCGQSGFFMHDIGLVGALNCCKNGIAFLNCNMIRMQRVNAFMNATEYAFSLKGCIYGQIDTLGIGHSADVYGTYYGGWWPENGILVGSSPEAGGENQWTFSNLVISGCGPVGSPITSWSGYGLKVEDCQNLYVNGSIEATGYPLYITGGSKITIDTCYMMDGNSNGLYIDGDSALTAERPNVVDIKSSLYYTLGYSKIRNSHNVKISNTVFKDAIIEASCKRVVLHNILAETFKCDAPDTQYITPVELTGVAGCPVYPAIGQGFRNFWDNSSAYRWYVDTAKDYPRDWGDAGYLAGTYTKCGVGEADTTRHWAPKTAKVNTDGGTAGFQKTIDASVLPFLKGNYVTIGVWLKAQTLPAGTLPFIEVTPAVPDWSDGTVYKVNECVAPSAAYKAAHPDYPGWMMKCITPGTSGGSEPDWAATPGEHVIITDNTTKWETVVQQQNSAINYNAAAYQGVWVNLSNHAFIPANATAIVMKLYLYQTAGAADIDYYLADPYIYVGSLQPKGPATELGELRSFIQLGANRLTCGPSSGEPSNPSTGDLYWINNVTAGTTTVLEYYNGTSWVSIAKTP